MNRNDTSDKEASESTRKNLRVTVCANGVVNVRNPESDEGHSVMLDAQGNAVRCSCKGHRFHGHCYHTGEVESRPLIVSSAVAASSTYAPKPVATDGGTVEEPDPDMRCEECGAAWCEGVEGAQCPACGSTDRQPRRHESPDMGGGESTGVVDLE